jgi:hypothetical protein
MNLQSYINSKNLEMEKTLEKASETIKMVRWCHRFYNKYMGRLLIEIPMYLGVFINPSIISIVGLPTLMYYSKSIQSTIEKLIYSISTITRDMMLLNKAKNFSEMEPEQGYGQSI